ncbi:glycosyltransferase family A protein [Acinetobacter calcoaceticus]|nr:glycosyltransferase family A protein [Acinetobacter calcoaceticus]
MIEIIIPTYKPKEYFYECLSSLDNQKISFSKFRVVIVLNGPKEPYYSLILKWLEDFDFNVLLMHTDTSGVSHARNIALNNCDLDVDYVCFLDDDDIFLKTT